jgi:hypothetical protein
MELDLSFLQLTLNVITVTAIPSLAMNCYLLRRDKEKLVTAILNSPLELDPHHPENPKPDPSPAASKPITRPGFVLKMPPAPPTLHTKTDTRVYPDIRKFVTQRSSNWVAPSKSQWEAQRPTATL